jgi:hypothetical protein
MSDINSYKINIGNVSVSSNDILSFILKEECPSKIPKKNTYIVKIQGIEMNNISQVEKITIERGVHQFFINLEPIKNTLLFGKNTLEIEGTCNMMVKGAGYFDGFYSLTCGENTLSAYSGNGLYLYPDSNVGIELAGFYSRRVVSSTRIIYEKFSNNNKYVLFYYPPAEKWFIKQTISNGTLSNKIYFQQINKGEQEEVPLKGWTFYIPGGIPPPRNTKDIQLKLKTCIPFESSSSDLILVNSAGIDSVNGAYYKDIKKNEFVNVRNKKIIIRYFVDDKNANSCWRIQECYDSSKDWGMQDEDLIDKKIGKYCKKKYSVLYTGPLQHVVNGSIFSSCIPCSDWKKASPCSPGDAPQVTILEYFNPEFPQHRIRYFDNGTSTWSLFDGTTVVARGTSDHYIVTRGGCSAPPVNGVYCLTCVNPENCPDYTHISFVGPPISEEILVLGYNAEEKRWEIRTNCEPGTDVIYFSNSEESSVPPFDGWVNAVKKGHCSPIVISSVVPSCVTWTLLSYI